jgi:ribosomal protein S18 acetylase RimI-like enzyme
VTILLDNLGTTGLEKLHAFWERTGAEIPYFFPTSPERWQCSLLEDRLEGELVFSELRTAVALRQGNLAGFVQYGRPAFAWNEHGQKYANPPWGVLRQLYFDPQDEEAGRMLLERALEALDTFERQHAFYHAMGMSCTAYHGKLHESQAHVERLLLEHGFGLEHENIYYLLSLEGQKPPALEGYTLHAQAGEAGETAFILAAGAERAGTARIRWMESLCGEQARQQAYLTWIGIAAPFRSRGTGTIFMELLLQHLHQHGIRRLHTDTASTNQKAQRYYERLGFINKGRTRSYFRSRRGARPSGCCPKS